MNLTDFCSSKTKHLFLLATCLTLHLLSKGQSQASLANIPEINTQLKIGDSLQNLGKYEQALLAFSKGRKLAKEINNWEKILECEVKRGRIFDLMQNREAHWNCITKARILAEMHLPDFHPIRGDIYQQMGEIYILRRNGDSATYFLRNAQVIFEGENAWKKYASCDILQGINAYYEQNFPLMESHLIKAMTVEEKYLENISPSIFNLLGVVYEASGDYEKALQTVLKSISLRLQKATLTDEDTIYLGTEFNNVGFIYLQKQDFKNALRYFQQAENILILNKNLDPLGLIEVYTNIGSLYDILEEKETAYRYYDLAFSSPITKDARASKLRIAILQNLSKHHLKYHEMDLAFSILEKLLNIHKVDSTGMKATFKILGLAYYEDGKFQESESAFLKAIEIENKNAYPNRKILASFYKYLGDTYTKLNKTEAALEAFSEGIRALDIEIPNSDKLYIPQIKNLPVDKYTLLQLMAGRIATLKKGLSPADTEDWQKLLKNVDATIELIDEINQTYLLDQTQSNIESSSIFESGINACWQLFLHTGDETFVHKAYELSEKSKAFVLQNRMKKMKAIHYADVPDKWIERDKQLRRDIAFYEDKIFQENHRKRQDSVKLPHWEEKSFFLHRAYEAFNDSLKNQYPKYTQLARDPKVASISAIQHQLKNDKTAVIVYFYGEESQYAFRITKDEISLIPISLDDTFSASFQALLFSLKDKYSVETQAYEASAFKSWTRHSFFCYQRLMEGILPDEMQHIIIVPDGPLAYFPFELLLTESSENSFNDYRSLPFLLKKSAISYEYAASLLVKENTKRKGPEGFFAGFGPETRANSAFKGNSGLHFLKHAKSEVDAIQTVIGGKKFLGSQATEENFKNLASDFQFLHLATHGTTDDFHPENSYLAFYSPEDSVDGRLHLNEIYGLSLQAHLSVLSACNTGTGPLARGKGIISLAHAFKYAGSENIIMSLWQVDDAMTQDLMLAFYANLAEGMSLAEALRQAKLSYLTASPRPHPFFWGAFVLIGNDAELILDSKPERKEWLIVVFISLLIAGFIFYKVRIKLGRS